MTKELAAGAPAAPTAVREPTDDVLGLLSPWNTPVDRAPVVAGSAAMLNRALAGRPTTTGVRIATAVGTTPVVSGGVPTVLRCRQVQCGDGGASLTLDVPPDVRPDPLHDGWLTVVDGASHTADDLLRARREDDGSISYAFLRRWDLDGPGFSPPYVEGARGSGLPLVAGLVRSREVERGQVDHALAIALPGPAAGSFVRPASTTDGTGAPGAVPEGARLRLRADVVLRSGPLRRRSTATLVQALKTYGAVVVGRAAVPTLYAEDPRHAATGDAGAGAALTGHELEGLHLDDFDVVGPSRLRRLPFPAADQPLDDQAVPAPATSRATGADASPPRVLVGTLPDPLPGVVVVDGDPDPLTRATIHGAVTGGVTSGGPAGSFRTSPGGRGVRVETRTSGAARAYGRLCIGQVDVVDASTPINAAQWAQCRADGLDVVQLQVAADAVVVATSSATDVGTDCLSTDQLARAFGRGSDVDDYAALGGDPGPFAAAAPGPAVGPAIGTVSGSFADRVLDDPEPVGSDLRADLIRTSDGADTARRVAGTARDRRLVERSAGVAATRRRLLDELAVRRATWEAAERAVRSPTGAPAAAIDRRARAFTRLRAARTSVLALRPRYLADAAARRRVESTRGVTGLFDQGSYIAAQDLLRPFEVELAAPAGGAGDCVFPSPQTILSGRYPLARPLLLTVSTRSLRRPEVRALLSYYLTHARPQAIAQGLVPVPRGAVARQLAWVDGGTLPTFAPDDGGVVAEQPVATATPSAPPTYHTRPAR